MSARRRSEKLWQNRIHGRLRLAKAVELHGVRVPAGAILAKREQQARNNSYLPPLFYEDRAFTCAGCGKREVWTAEQQHWWYEVAKGPVQSTAVRCRGCRRKLRAARDEQRKRSAEGRARKSEAR